MAKKLLPEIKPIEEIFPGWSTLGPDERRFVKSNSSVQYFKKNEVILYEGEKPNHMMVLALGKAKVYKEGIGNRAQIIRIYKAGDPFGYHAIIENEYYKATVSAFETSAAYLLKKDVFISILQNNNAFCFYFLKELVYNITNSDARIINLTQKHIRGRLAETLLFLRRYYGLEEDNETINIYLSREDLANLSNMTTSNAIRTLSNFANEDIIEINGRRIKVIDEERLIKISKLG